MLRKTHLPETLSPENICLSFRSYFTGDHSSQLYVCPSARVKPEH